MNSIEKTFQKLTISGFLEAYYPNPDEPIHLRFFSPRDAEETARNRPEKLTTTRAAIASDQSTQQRLKALNETRGAYFVVNAGGDKDTDINRFNAFFVENDTKTIEEQHAALDLAPLLPSIRVETKKSVHAYWLIEGNCTAEQWREVQERLIAFFDGDSAIKNPSRVMRLPGLDHVSADGRRKRVECVSFEPESRYTAERMLEAFPPAQKQKPQIVRANNERAPDERERKYALAALAEEELRIRSAANGKRNDTLNQAAFSLGQIIGAGWLSESLVEATLTDAAQSAGLRDSEIRATLKSGLEAGRKEPRRLPESSRNSVPASDKEQPQTESEEQGIRLATSWLDFERERFPQGEQIAFAVERGEIALLNALPNAGKTTLALNAAVSLSAGRLFAPVVREAKPRRILYIDGETRRARLQRDLRTMTAGFSREEAVAVGQNLHLICEAEIAGESLSITRTDHLLYLSAEAIRIKPDLIVIDTLASLCPVFNENDNAEQQRKIWRPLQKLARDCDAAILVLHHVGKRSEDSQTPERVYRGRGASASGGAARAVWLLIPDSTTPGLSTLSCAKAKGEQPKDVRLQLNLEERWLRAIEIEPQKIVTPLERVLQIVSREMKAADIKAALKPELSERTIEIALAEALQLDKLRLVKRGVYAPAFDSAETAETAERLFAETAEAAELGRFEPETEFPQFPRSPIGVAEIAETVTAYESNGLGQKPQRARKMALRKLAEDEEVF